MIKFRCTHCRQKLGVDTKYAGRRVKCSKCGEISAIPKPKPVEQYARLNSSRADTTINKIETSRQVVEKICSKKSELSENLETKPKEHDLFEELGMNGLGETDENQDDRLQEALRIAREGRAAKRAKGARIPSPRGKSKPLKEINPEKTRLGKFSLIDMIPDVLHMPLALVSCFGAMAATIGIWVAAARATESAMGFFALLVPLAGAAGLRAFTVNRSFLLGLSGILIAGLGITGGKIIVAKSVVIPAYNKMANKEILVDLDEILKEARLEDKGQRQSIKPYATDGDFQVCIALISMVDDNLADPAKARKYCVERLDAANKTNIYQALLNPGRRESAVMPDNDDLGSDVFDEVYTRIDNWDENKLLLKTTKKYFPALKKIGDQAEMSRRLRNEEQLFKMALLDTMGIFDLVWLLLGMGLSYITLVFD